MQGAASARIWPRRGSSASRHLIWPRPGYRSWLDSRSPRRRRERQCARRCRTRHNRTIRPQNRRTRSMPGRVHHHSERSLSTAVRQSPIRGGVGGQNRSRGDRPRPTPAHLPARSSRLRRREARAWPAALPTASFGIIPHRFDGSARRSAVNRALPAWAIDRHGTTVRLGECPYSRSAP